MKNKTSLSTQEREAILSALHKRFERNMQRHADLAWKKVEEKLLGNPGKLWSLNEMEDSGGEPDVIAFDKTNATYQFCDCSAESPKGRRSLCYDEEALQSRKQHKPKDSALNLAASMGIELLSEAQYRQLQTLGEFDLKTSSWVKTPDNIRELDGALFCDRRYNTVFLYHNGAESYYAARGFRGILTV